MSKHEYLGDNIVLSVSIAGPDMYSYQWVKDGEAITDNNCSNYKGATSHKLHITPLKSENKGSYYRVISSEAGSVKSKSAVVKGITCE